MLVKATQKGFDGVTLRNPGDVFNMPDGQKGGWFFACDDEGKPLSDKPKPVGKKAEKDDQ